MTPVATEPHPAPASMLPLAPVAPSPTPAEQALALVRRSGSEIDALLARVFEQAAVGIALVGLDGDEREIVLEANPSFAAIFGRTIGALRGTAAMTLSVDPSHAPALARANEELERGTAEVQRGQYRFVRGDGERIWLDVTVSLVRTDAGLPRYRLVHAVDVSAQRG